MRAAGSAKEGGGVGRAVQHAPVVTRAGWAGDGQTSLRGCGVLCLARLSVLTLPVRSSVSAGDVCNRWAWGERVEEKAGGRGGGGLRGSWRTRYLWFSPPFGRVCGLLRCCVLGAAVDALRQGLCRSTFGAALLHTQVCTALSAPGLAGTENLSARQHSTGGDRDAGCTHEHLAHERRGRGGPPCLHTKAPAGTLRCRACSTSCLLLS